MQCYLLHFVLMPFLCIMLCLHHIAINSGTPFEKRGDLLGLEHVKSRVADEKRGNFGTFQLNCEKITKWTTVLGGVRWWCVRKVSVAQLGVARHNWSGSRNSATTARWLRRCSTKPKISHSLWFPKAILGDDSNYRPSIMHHALISSFPSSGTELCSNCRLTWLYSNFSDWYWFEQAQIYTHYVIN